jgi:hypothetical protein
MSVQITNGTQTSIYTKTNAGTDVQVVKLDIGSGTALQDFGGTITEVSNVANLAKGTITSVANVAGGTIIVGSTVNATPLVLGTVGTAGGSLFGTISGASGAGTKHYISGVDIVVSSGTPDVRVLIGTGIQGGSVLAAGLFLPSNGISKLFIPPFVTGTNSEITYHFVNAGTAQINVSYWKGV